MNTNVDITFSTQEEDNFVPSLSWLVYHVWYIVLLYSVNDFRLYFETVLTVCYFFLL